MMMSQPEDIRPQRWDKPFGATEMSSEDVDRVLALPPFVSIDAGEFPANLPLRGILANDARLRRFSRGDVIVRRGDYGSSLFVLIQGSVRGLASESGEDEIVPHAQVRKRSWYSSLSQLWRNARVPEYRAQVRYLGARSADRNEARFLVVSRGYVGRDRRRARASAAAAGGAGYRGSERRRTNVGKGESVVVRLTEVDDIIARHPTFTVVAPQMFGELAALSRSPRTATIFADSDVEAVELRWQGLRDIRRWSDGFRAAIDALYRERGILAHLRAAPIFAKVDDAALAVIAGQTLFESYGNFEWTHAFRTAQSRSDRRDRILEHEPVIAEEDHYIDGLLLIARGFARVSERVDHGEKTVDYLTSNDVFGLEELAESWRSGVDHKLKRTLRALGYVDVLRVPTRLVEQHVLPTLADGAAGLSGGTKETPLIDFLVDNRIINGTAAMLVDNNRCVNCDDCVRACAATHDGNPRFVRHGEAHLNIMVANACMHCVDPVCLIGCPTGAIHRSAGTGIVIIDDPICIGCGTCAQSCPYNNIRMVETRDETGASIVDNDKMPIMKATKCDLCSSQIGGPACQRACPHDALIRIDIRDSDALTRWLSR